MVNSAGEKDKYSLQFELKNPLSIGSINKVCMYVCNDSADRKSMPEMERS